MKSAVLMIVSVVVFNLVSAGKHHRTHSLIPNLFDRLTHRVDTITDRIDSGLQQTLNPVIDQLHQNVRETLNIWSRPFSVLASGHGGPPAPVAPPATPANKDSTQGTPSLPFDLGLSPFFQGLFDNLPRDWWKGPNVCIEREEIDETRGVNRTLFGSESSDDAEIESEPAVEEEGADSDEVTPTETTRQQRQFNAHVRMSSCKDEGLSYVCETKIRSNGVRKTYKTRYACCFGTTREAREFGCHAVELRSLQETVFALGGRSFLTMMKEAQIDERTTAANRTYFVPVDRSAPEATADSANDVNAVEDEIIDDNGEDLRRERRQTSASSETNEPEMREIRTTVLSHMVPGIYLTTDLHDEQMLPTEDPEAKIRINTYNAPDRVYTANCVRLVSTNHYSQQGVVHMLDGVMKPATKTIGQLLDSEEHFSSFRNLIGEAVVTGMLNEPGQLTVFAPTDEAFAKLDAETRDRLMKGQGCIHSVVKQHLLPNVICSTVIKGRARSTTMLGSSLLLERDLEGKLYVNGKQVITRDVMASNGVLHVIDGVLIPENARSFSQFLSSRNLTEFSRLVETAGLTTYLDSLSNATLFAPTNDAFRAIADEVKQGWIADPESLKQVLLNHVSKPMIRQSTAVNNQLIPTQVAGQALRLNLYSSMPLFNGPSLRATAQCSSILRWEQEACNGNVHIVDRVLLPPGGSLTQWLANNRSFSIMTKLLKSTRLSDILSAEGPYTVLAAPDVAFYQMPEEELSEMTKDSSKASAVLKMLILPEQLCCSAFRGDWFSSNRRRTMDGAWIPLQRHLDGHLTAGDAQVLSCDHLANNGVIHVIDKVPALKASGGLPFLSGTRRVGLPLSGVELLFNGGK